MSLQATPVSAPLSSEEWLERARAIAPIIDAEGVATEEGQTLSPTAVQALKDAELPWAGVPAELGGGGVDALTLVQLIEEITRADAAAGWSYMVNAVGPTIASVNLPAEAIADFYGGDDRVITAGFGGPNGWAKPVDGGYIIRSERMPFGSGTLHATRIICGLKLLGEDGEPVRTESGGPDVRFAYVPADKIIFHGNWDTIGLTGSGSVEYELPEQFIEAKYVTTRDESVKRHDPLTALGEYGITFLGHTGVALGAMKRGLQEIARIAHGKRRGFLPVPVGEYPVFLSEFAQADAKYQSARAFALAVIGDAWESAITEGAISELQLTRLRQASTWTHVVGGEVLDFAYLWAGTEPLRRTNALGRTYRDLRAARNHYVVDPTSLPEVGVPISAWWRGDAEDKKVGTAATWHETTKKNV